MLEDVALMRVLPNMRVLVPADYAAARAALKLAAATPGPVYVRMGRASVPCVYADDMELELGRAYVLRPGDDVTIVACGVEIREALAAAELLAEQGVSAEVVDAFSVKPLDAETILASAREDGARRRGRGAQRRRAAWARRWPTCLLGAILRLAPSSACRTSSAKSGEFEQLLGALPPGRGRHC